MKQLRTSVFVSMIFLSFVSINGCENENFGPRKDKSHSDSDADKKFTNRSNDKKVSVITGEITNVMATSATVSGEVVSDCKSNESEKSEYIGKKEKEEAVRGIVISTTVNPTMSDTKIVSGGGVGTFKVDFTGLTPNTTYHVRAFATCKKGTSYGEDKTFNTFTDLPIVTTAVISSITLNSAISGGNVTDEGGATVTVRGICWSTAANPTIEDSKTSDGSGSGSFTSSLVDLALNTKYYVRAYATNIHGTAYGLQQSFQTESWSTAGNGVTDIDGNTYSSVIILGKEWMAENLRVSRYNDGAAIPEVIDNASWSSLSSGAFTYLDNDVNYNSTYGKLYNYYTILDSRKVCPSGWHIPMDNEWQEMTTFLGNDAIASSRLRTDTGWNGTNESLFTALPSGGRLNNGNYTNGGYAGGSAIIWMGYGPSIPSRYIQIYEGGIKYDNAGTNEKFGYSIRCVKD